MSFYYNNRAKPSEISNTDRKAFQSCGEKSKKKPGEKKVEPLVLRCPGTDPRFAVF